MNEDYATIEEAIKVVESTMDVFLGTGLKDAKTGTWDTGISMESNARNRQIWCQIMT